MSACGNSNSQQNNTPADDAGKIGEKVWMPKNLDVTTFRNGDPIKEAKTADEWKSAYENEEPAWCYYGNNPENAEKYGVLYNWFAVKDSRGLCPEGWSIASENDWKDLVNALGGGNTAGSAMKHTNEWNNDTDGENNSGFSALPAGARDANGDFYGLNQTAIWWTSTEWIGNKICTYVLEAGQSYCIDYPASTDEGHAVRCVKN
ncbi:MAG: fibrobacter succinogenes major paralogous domain-containing protein [Bacteroidales bacterium]|nr:fibrobacter succinogenes major paralogous domain-containing protein [Bacteroidales bacterium]MDD4176945.1 fibrobacter succinogenes major paralogous domain-containing protein [Bacteroidales bacterium]MDY0334148.1 fibrobacter succinogenes major paralogous domain-containing protein [Bacteroidales bacterium]